MKMILGLCEDRHQLPSEVEGYIYPKTVDPLNTILLSSCYIKLAHCSELHLYVTGLTVALITVLNYCASNKIPVTLYHFDNNSKNYFTQEVYNNF